MLIRHKTAPFAKKKCPQTIYSIHLLCPVHSQCTRGVHFVESADRIYFTRIFRLFVGLFSTPYIVCVRHSSLQESHFMVDYNVCWLYNDIGNGSNRPGYAFAQSLVPLAFPNDGVIPYWPYRITIYLSVSSLLLSILFLCISMCI